MLNAYLMLPDPADHLGAIVGSLRKVAFDTRFDKEVDGPGTAAAAHDKKKKKGKNGRKGGGGKNANAAKGEGKGKGNENGKSPDCEHCGRRGHRKKDC